MQNANVDAEQRIQMAFGNATPLRNVDVEQRMPNFEKVKPLRNASVEQRIPHCEKEKPL